MPGEVKAIECHWESPEQLLFDCYQVYTGVGEEPTVEEEMMSLDHPHHVQDKDNEGYWDEILAYLHLECLPKSSVEVEKIRQRAQHFFLMNGTLWHRNGDKPPLLVILSHEV